MSTDVPMIIPSDNQIDNLDGNIFTYILLYKIRLILLKWVHKIFYSYN